MKPVRLQPGDLIGVLAPSRFVTDSRADLEKGISCLKRFGFDIVLSDNLYKKYRNSAGTVEERLSDLHQMFINPKIKAIICAVGGDSANQLLNKIDYNLVKKNPKIFIGYSDITHLLLAFYQKTGLITFHGPSLRHLSQKTKKSQDFLIDIITGKDVSYPNSFKILKKGKAEGILMGGNLFVVNSMLSSGLAPDFKNAILFIEDIDEGLSMIEYQLNQLKNSGILEKINGLIIGHIKTKEKNIDQVITEILADYSFPAVKVDYFGHQISEFLTMPIGINAILDTQTSTFKLLEKVVE